MRRASIGLVAALLLAVCAMAKPAEAGPRVSFGYYGPGFSIYVGPRPYYYRPYYYRPYYYRPYYYRPYYRSYRYYAPRRYYRTSRCSRWRSRCARNWGYGGRNYRGCMRYHGCR